MAETNITPAQADKILRLLADLWADQHGMKVTSITITDKRDTKSA